MPKEFDPWVGVVILIRVVFILVIWLLLFLAMFLGYFTVPILLIGGVTLIYAVLDVGQLVGIRRQERANAARLAQLEQQKDTQSKES